MFILDLHLLCLGEKLILLAEVIEEKKQENVDARNACGGEKGGAVRACQRKDKVGNVIGNEVGNGDDSQIHEGLQF